MTILDRFVLPADVVIEPVANLNASAYCQLECEPSDYYVTRPRSRAVSSIVDFRTASLLKCFQAPTTIVDAIKAFSVAEGLDPRDVLDEAFSALAAMANDGFLLPESSALAQPIDATLRPGDQVTQFAIIDLVQVLEDTEVYLARATDGAMVALKIARISASGSVAAMFSREAQALQALDASVTPRLLESGDYQSRPFVALEWRIGVDLLQAVAELHGLPERVRRPRLLHLAQAVLDAYAHLHGNRVLHGDVHPRNVLVGANNVITLVDFGLSSEAVPGSMPIVLRGGVALYQEPELAIARLDDQPLPAASPAGEQYAIGALLYQILTGSHTHAFSLEHDTMLRQVVNDPPLSFDSHGIHYSPDVEACLMISLAKQPGARHESVAVFASKLRTAISRVVPATKTLDQFAGEENRAASALLVDMLEHLDPVAHGFRDDAVRPFVSVMNGAAGISYFLLRVAMIRNDAALLAQADLWSTKAVLSLGSDNAFWNPSLGLTSDIVGEASLYHHACGVHCVEALVAHARGDGAAQAAALRAFVATAQPCALFDVSFGRAGLLIGCAVLAEALGVHRDMQEILALGTLLCDALWTEVETLPPLADATAHSSLGAAHGWAGMLFAVLRWGGAALVAPPRGLQGRLMELAELGRPVGRGMRWPIKQGFLTHGSALDASWCNGAAGYVYLWETADKTYPQQGFQELAEWSAWSAFESAEIAPGTLCCGLAGRAYALRHRYAQTGDEAWLARARLLRDRAVALPPGNPTRRYSLFQGELGIALLTAELDDPGFARLPLYEAH